MLLLKRPLQNRILTFATPSIVSDTLKARAKVKRDLREILRAAEQYLGPQQIDQVVSDHGRARGGRTPNESLNELVLAEWDASPTKDKTEFAEAFLKKHPQGYTVKALMERLRRQRKARIKARRKDRKLKAALQRPSLVGKADGTE
jgi:hypothetical protein